MGATGSLKTVPLFKIDISMGSHERKVYNISKTHDGSLFIEAMNTDQVPKLIEMKKLCDYKVIVVLHGRLNTCRGVVTCKDLVYSTDEELCTGMRDSQVIVVKR